LTDPLVIAHLAIHPATHECVTFYRTRLRRGLVLKVEIFVPVGGVRGTLP
jgi:hypothetical protein